MNRLRFGEGFGRHPPSGYGPGARKKTRPWRPFTEAGARREGTARCPQEEGRGKKSDSGRVFSCEPDEIPFVGPLPSRKFHVARRPHLAPLLGRPGRTS